ncbi:hypothetical protein WNY37_09945 [Henriciella sp. AS95]|uniref:hypothetical protein n=1 Tax=Henriciella sp. AS95 TaxID=3135782 RepID=UPI00317A9A42
MSSFVTIRWFAALPEALACKSFLEANGVFAVINDFEHITVQWYLIEALGGVRVSVASKDFEEANLLLEEVTSASKPEQDYEQPEPYGRIAAWAYLLAPQGLLAALVGLLAIPFWLAGLATDQTMRRTYQSESIQFINDGGAFLLPLFLIASMIWIFLDAKAFYKAAERDKHTE